MASNVSYPDPRRPHSDVCPICGYVRIDEDLGICAFEKAGLPGFEIDVEPSLGSLSPEVLRIRGRIRMHVRLNLKPQD